MNRSLAIIGPFLALCLIVALLAVIGCGKPDARTMTIFQYQSTETYKGHFLVDTSGLPADAIKIQSETGGPFQSETRMEINSKYDVEVVLRVAKSHEGRMAKDGPDEHTAK